MSHGQPASVLLHTVGYLLLHPPSYYPLITYWAGRRGKWVTASIAPTPIHFSNQASDTPPIRIAITLLGSPGSLLKLINSPPELCRCPSEQACSIPRNTHILLPGTFHAIINPDFCPTHCRGIFQRSRLGLNMEARDHEIGKNWVVFAGASYVRGGGQLCRRASRLQGGRWDSTQLSASSPSFMDLSARTVTGLGAKPRGVGPTTGSHWVPVM